MRDIESKLRAKMHDQLDELRMPDRLLPIRQRARRQRLLFATGGLLFVVALGVVGSAWGLNPLNGPNYEESVVGTGNLSNLPGELLFAAFGEGTSSNSALYTMKPDGTNRTSLLEGSGLGHQLEQPSWSPDRNKVAFNVYLPNRGGDFDFLNSEIFVVDADGTERRRLTHDSEPVVAPAWSPDGTRVVFARADEESSWELWAMNSDGSDQQLLTDATTAGDAAWSSDGRRIVFSQFLYHKGERDPHNQELFVMDIASRTVTRITHTPARESAPAWSPDGSHIAFISEASGKESGLFVMNTNESTPTELVPQGVSSVPGLAWSPDGRRIALVKTNRWSNPPPEQDQDQIAVVSAEGGDPQPIGPGVHMILGIDWR